MRDDWPIYLFVIAFVGIIGFFIYDGASGEDVIYTGKIHEMTFVHGNQTTTVGMAFTSKGAAPVIATSGRPDEWSMIVFTNDNYIKIECDANQYYHHEVGDNVRIKERHGRLTGKVWNTEVIN